MGLSEHQKSDEFDTIKFQNFLATSVTKKIDHYNYLLTTLWNNNPISIILVSPKNIKQIHQWSDSSKVKNF